VQRSAFLPGKLLVLLSWVPVAALYLYQLLNIRRYAVDIPYWDEWEYFRPDALPAGFTWQWLFKFHNEHRIVPTKLMAWLNLEFFGLDFVLQQLVNFVLFGCLLAAVYFLARRVTGDDRFSVFPLFLVFLLSPLNYANHLWAFQSQFHLVLLFGMLALGSAFPERVGWSEAIKFSLLTILAIYSFSAGPVFAIVFAGCFLVYVFAANRQQRVTARDALLAVAIVVGFLGAGLVCWFHGYVKPPLHPELVYPVTARFWSFFLSLTGLGFGYTPAEASTGWIMGALCLVSVLLPVVALLLNKKTRWQPGTWTVATGIAAILALLAAIAMGRADLELPGEPRYNEFAFMLIPLAALAWWQAAPQGRIRLVALSLLWLLCSGGYLDKWSFDVYREVQQQRTGASECIAGYYLGQGDGNCPMSYDVPLNNFLDRAKQLRINFVRKLRSGDDGMVK
jgi:hypothetical protein